MFKPFEYTLFLQSGRDRLYLSCSHPTPNQIYEQTTFHFTNYSSIVLGQKHVYNSHPTNYPTRPLILVYMNVEEILTEDNGNLDRFIHRITLQIKIHFLD